jgi:hypothetical protein
MTLKYTCNTNKSYLGLCRKMGTYYLGAYRFRNRICSWIFFELIVNRKKKNTPKTEVFLLIKCYESQVAAVEQELFATLL